MIPHFGGMPRKRLRTFWVYNIFMKECRELLSLQQLLLVFFPYNLVRVSGEFAKKVGGGGAGINANPMFGRKVERAPDAVVAGFEFPDAVGLALERDNAIIVAIEKGEHMAVHIKHQHTCAVRESRKRHLLHHIGAKRKTKVTICLNVSHNAKIEIFCQRKGKEHGILFSLMEVCEQIVSQMFVEKCMLGHTILCCKSVKMQVDIIAKKM